MIIDSHLHFYDMLAEPPGDVHHDHLPFERVIAEAREIGVGQIVQVTPFAAGYDNRHGFAVAERHPADVLGVIARIDPLHADVQQHLRALLQNPKMLALRLTLIEDNEHWLADGTVDDFFRLAERLQVPMELFAPFHVAQMHDTVKRFPGVRWLIDHMGLRYYAGKDNRQAFRQWDALLDLAQEPNVWIKCSYFPEAAKDLEDYPFPLARSYMRQLYERAGAGRLIWGSNFPNVRRACTYRQALDFIRTGCDFMSVAEREAITGANFLRYVAREATPV
ncbi:amidohydrolase family protein [Caballeronia sp. LjRoot31]|uniref:amidohydrolase family protein n=1 Tax=Caballeronia sp. LjRoot31 TaxID=3342324 RepID=UPI003ECFDED3